MICFFMSFLDQAVIDDSTAVYDGTQRDVRRRSLKINFNVFVNIAPGVFLVSSRAERAFVEEVEFDILFIQIF